MAKSSIHIANGGDGYIAHNSRESFSQSQVFYDEKNEIWNNKEKAFKLFRFELAARSDAYTKRTKQKLQKKSITHLSAIVNLNQNHTLEDLKPLAKYLEDELDTKIFQVAIHRDEGKLVHATIPNKILTSGEHFFSNPPKNKKLYFDKNFENEIDLSEWNFEKNYHAHFEMLGLDSDGNSIRRKLNNKFFRKLQDKTAELLGMERGNASPSYTKEEMKQIRYKLHMEGYQPKNKEYGKKFIEVAKELNLYKPKPNHKKRKDTHDHKDEKAKENEILAKEYAKQKDLKEDIAKLKKQLQEQGAKREQYAELEQLNRDLKAKIKAKDLTIEQLQDKLQMFEQVNIALKEQNQALKAKIATLPSSDTFEKLKTLNEAVNQENANIKKDLTSALLNISKIDEQNQVFRQRLKTQKREISEISTELTNSKQTNSNYKKTINSLGQLLQKFYNFVFNKSVDPQASLKKIWEELDDYAKNKKIEKINTHDVTKVPTLLDKIENDEVFKKDHIPIEIEKNSIDNDIYRKL